MKRSDDSTHPCRSAKSTVNGWDLTPPTRTQTSEQEYIDLTANITGNRQHCTIATFPEAFHEGPVRMLSRSTKHV